MKEATGLLVFDSDNVATVFTEVGESDVVKILNTKGNFTEKIIAGSCIPYGHKIALKNIKKKEEIIKFGEIIGIASENIKKGVHVHISNVESTRGRGDLTEKNEKN